MPSKEHQPLETLAASSSMTAAVLAEDGRIRPRWAMTDPLLLEYFDNEWGLPVRTEQGVFERLTLEAFQSGLSWLIILRKRAGFRAAFSSFDPEVIANYQDADVERLLADSNIVRNRAKILATINNAQATLRLRESESESGDLASLVWSFSAVPDYAAENIPSQSEASVALAKALKKHGFKFVGPTTAYSLMEATGIINNRKLYEAN